MTYNVITMVNISSTTVKTVRTLHIYVKTQNDSNFTIEFSNTKVNPCRMMPCLSMGCLESRAEGKRQMEFIVVLYSACFVLFFLSTLPSRHPRSGQERKAETRVGETWFDSECVPRRLAERSPSFGIFKQSSLPQALQKPLMKT